MLAAGAFAAMQSADVQALAARPVILGQVSLSFYAVTGAVVHAVLERLGHTVEVRHGLHEQMFPMLGDGSIDLMAAAWLPEGHVSYWERYGRSAVEVATLYDAAHFFWAVPAYVPADIVQSIEDLKKPDVANRMNRQIQGIGSGAGISQLSQKAVTAYGLDQLGFRFQPGTQEQWIDRCEAAMQAGEWFIFPTWAPQFLNRDDQLRPLADPKSILGCMNRAVLASPATRWAELPDATRAVLQRVQLSIDAVTEMDWLVNKQQSSPRAAAARWMHAHPAQTEPWFAG